MTTNQLTKKLAHIKGVSVASSKTITVDVKDSDGVTNRHKSSLAASKVIKVLAGEGWGGYSCGWGGYYLTKGYQGLPND